MCCIKISGWSDKTGHLRKRSLGDFDRMLEQRRKAETKFFRNQFVPQTKKPLLWQGSLSNKKHWIRIELIYPVNMVCKTSTWKMQWNLKIKIESDDKITCKSFSISKNLSQECFSVGTFLEENWPSIFCTSWWTLRKQFLFCVEMYKKLKIQKK